MRFTAALAAILFTAAAPALADGTSLILNGNFDAGDNGHVDFPYTNSHYFIGSSAPGWGLYNYDTYTHTSTDIVGTDGQPLVEVGDQVIKVTTDSRQNGLDQSIGGLANYFSADIKMLSGGTASIVAVYQNYPTWQNSTQYPTSVGADGWVHLVLDLSQVPYYTQADEIRIWGNDYAGDSFLVNNVYAGVGAPAAPVPEPGEWAMMLGGLGVAALAAKRRRAAA